MKIKIESDAIVLRHMAIKTVLEKEEKDYNNDTYGGVISICFYKDDYRLDELKWQNLKIEGFSEHDMIRLINDFPKLQYVLSSMLERVAGKKLDWTIDNILDFDTELAYQGEDTSTSKAVDDLRKEYRKYVNK